MIPAHYLQDQYRRSLRAYVQDYLKEEVFAEGLARNAGAFSRFLEAAGHSHGEPINYFWRTKSGLEVDFILAGGEMVLEVKGGGHVDERDLYALRNFAEEFTPKHASVVCNEKEERLVEAIRVVPWRTFLANLWAAEYL